MQSIELLTRIILQTLVVVLIGFFCVRLFTGCTLVRQTAAKERIVLALKTAYNEGGREAVSNRIDRLVASGDLSPKQAARLHDLAQTVYDHVLEKLEAEIDLTAK